MGHTASIQPTTVPLFLKVGFALMAVVAIGCSMSATSNPGTNNVPTPTGVDADIDEASAFPDVPYIKPQNQAQGSPLCNANKWTGCYPDDPTSTQECNLELDGGKYVNNGMPPAQLACHVERIPGELGGHPVCAPPGPGGDGAPCLRGIDCQAGLECVGEGFCRNYCCDGSCSNSGEFCDIQTTTDSRLKVPVCMPIHSCALLDSSLDGGSCAPNETCAVVRDNGATGCVAVGPRQAGDGCDTDHCARQLTCLGGAGERNCYALCHTSPRANDCPPGESCIGGLPTFPLPGIGVCK
jgi:hypothetical protein